MSKLIRRYLIPALIAALAGTGVSFAATGSVVPFQDDTTQVSDHQDETTDLESEAPEEAAEREENKTEDEVEEADDPADPEKAPKARSTEGCDGAEVKNHGQFVSQSEDHHEAAQSACGKPVKADKSEKDGGPEVEAIDKDAPDDEDKDDDGHHSDKHEDDAD